MSMSYCCVPGCAGSEDSHPVLHVFPNPEKDPDRFRSWVLTIGGDILGLENNWIYKNRRVCHQHFEQQYCYYSNRLSQLAIPTKKLPGPMHSFPHREKCPEQFKAWCNLVPENLRPPQNELHNTKVCYRHFTDRDRNRYSRLNALAVPTLFLPDGAVSTSIHGFSNTQSSQDSQQATTSKASLDHSYCDLRTETNINCVKGDT